MPTIHDRIKEDRDSTILQRGFNWGDLITFRNYANGKQTVILSLKQKEILRNLNNDAFCDNVCSQIISEGTGRIQFLGWECVNEPLNEWLSHLYKVAKLEGRQGDFHYHTLRDGNFALSVTWDSKKERIKICREDWWDGLSGVYLHYDSSGDVEYAVKEWTEKVYGVGGVSTPVSRRTIYYEDKIERYINRSNGTDPISWEQFQLEEDEAFPVPWVDENGEPLGIPMVHFPNVAKTYGDYGVSELDGGIVGFQDQLNDAQFSITITIRMTGGQQYYATGVRTKKRDGSTEEASTVKAEPGAFHTTPNENAKFGVLPAGDVEKQISGYNLKLKRVAQISATPLHVISGGDWPSGEALLRAEMPAVNKAWKQIFRLSTSYIEVATKAARIHNTFSSKDVAKIDTSIEKGIIETKFADPEKRDAISRSIIVHNLAANISKKEAMRIMNYSDEKAQQVYDEFVEESGDAADAMLSASLRGNVASGKGAVGGNNNTNSGAK